MRFVHEPRATLSKRTSVIRGELVKRTPIVRGKQILAFFVSSCIFSACSAADDHPDAETTAPTTTSTPTPTLDQLDQWLATLLRTTKAPAGVVAIQHGDGDPIVVSRGQTTDDPPRDVNADTHWRVASVTKSFVAALALVMEADGSIDLDSPIAIYLDSPLGDVTLRQLLTHTSGLPDFADDLDDPDAIDPLLLPFDRAYSLDEALQKAEELAPWIDVERGAYYSNANYVVAGAVLERAGGAPLGTLLRDRVLAVLQLDNTRYLPDEPDGPAPAGGLDDLGGGVEIPSEAFPRTSLITLVGPAAGVASDVDDMLEWANVIFRGRHLADVDLSPMLEIQPGGYGLGVAGVGESGTCVFDGCPPDETFTRFSLAGDFPGASTRIWYDPRTDTVLLVYLNRNALALDEPMAAFLDE